MLTIAAMALFVTVNRTWAQASETTFKLAVNPPFVGCLGSSSLERPTATVTVQRGTLNDVLILHARHLKPNLAFDLFTTQNSNLLANGQLDPNFKNFGWYGIRATSTDSNGNADVRSRRFCLTRFSFRSGRRSSPTNTFHVGFWFNN
jgi:hypothetical protein